MINFLLPPELPNLDAALHDAKYGSPDARWVAASALGRETGHRQSEATSALVHLLDDKFEEIRAQALEGLSEQARSGISIDRDLVMRALRDVTPAVRCTAVDAAMVVLADPGPAVLTCLEDEDPSVRIAVAAALGDLPRNEAVAPLKVLVQDPSALVRLEAAVALAFIGDNSGEEILLAAVSDNTDDTCDAARALGALGTSRAVPALEKLAGRLFGSAETKAIAGVALFRCSKGQKGRNLIAHALKSRRLNTRMAMLSALSRLPVPGIAEDVGALIDSGDDMIVSSAISAMVEIAKVDETAARAVLDAKRPNIGPELLKELDEQLPLSRERHAPV